MSAEGIETLQEKPKSTQESYYFVSINRPLREPFMDVILLKKATERYGINIDDGKFRIVSHHDTHAFYLYQFKNSKPASKATQLDFTMVMKKVSTSTILCDERDCLVTIDLELTTKSDAANAAAKAAVKAASDVLAAVVEMVKKNPDCGHMITQISSVPVTTIGAEAVQVPVVQLPSLPETMFNEMVKYEVGIKAESMGFIIASNTSTIDNVLTPFSQYFNSRPDLSIYHSEKSVAYVVQATQPDEEMDEESDKAQYVTNKAGVTEHKLKVKDDVGQLLAGMDKVAGHAAYMHLKRDVP